MSMPPPTGRFEKRTAGSGAVELSRINTSLLKERALTENVSSRGKRIAMEHEWKPGNPAGQICCRAQTFHAGRAMGKATLAARG
jgi:hypothetical protein